MTPVRVVFCSRAVLMIYELARVDSSHTPSPLLRLAGADKLKIISESKEGDIARSHDIPNFSESKFGFRRLEKGAVGTRHVEGYWICGPPGQFMEI
eukprot:1315703-Amorphochlora_amoeboformis.AAC.1